MKVGNPEVGKVGTKKGVKKVEEVHNGRRLVGYEVLKVKDYKTLGGFIRAAKAALKAVGLDPESELSALGKHNDGSKAWNEWTLLDDLKAVGYAEYHAAGDGYKYGFELDFNEGRIYAYNLEEADDQEPRTRDPAPGYGVTYEPDGSKVYHYKSGWKVRVKPEPEAQAKAEPKKARPKRFYRVQVGYMEEVPDYAAPVPYAVPRSEVAVVAAENEEEAKAAALRLVGVEDTGVILGVEDITDRVTAAITAALEEADAALIDAPFYDWDPWLKFAEEALKKRGYRLIKAYDFGPLYVLGPDWTIFRVGWEDGRLYIELPRVLPTGVKEELLKLSLELRRGGAQ